MRHQLKKWNWRGVLIATPSVAGLVIALRLTGLLQTLEWKAFDQFFRLRPLVSVEPRITIVGISESDLHNVRQWPIPDTILAQLLEKIKSQHPRAIGLDLYRDLPVEPGHPALVKVFKTTPNLIGIEKVVGSGNSAAIAPPPELSRLGQIGANDVVIDGDGKLRRGLLYVTPDDREAVPSLGLSLALIYLQAKGVSPEPAINSWLKLGRAVFVPFEANDGGYVRADAASYQILLNFRGPVWGSPYRIVSLTSVLQNRVPADWMRDRIVLIGTTAPSLNDFFYTPFSAGQVGAPAQIPGVEIQAHLASHIISAALEGRSAIKTWSKPVEVMWIVLWSGVGATLSWMLGYDDAKHSLFRGACSMLIAVSGLWVSCYLSFLAGWWLPIVPPGLALVSSAIVITAYLARLEREERQTVMNLFGRHVTPKIAEAIWRERHQLLQAGQLLGRQMIATVLFADLKGFSRVAESTEPEALMGWLNEYMEAMAQLVLKHDGVVDKFMGDAIMAVFGVPIARTTSEAIAKDAVAAARCAVEMASTLHALNQQWQTQGRPTAAMRVGIATGNVVTGSLGSSQRLDYTTIGDSVNVASRLESYDKSFDGGLCRILINEGTYQYIHADFPTKLLGLVQLRGREQQTKIHQIIV